MLWRARRTAAADSCAVLDDTGYQLEAYFAGELTEFDVAFDLHGTDFQRECWLALATIPYGQTVSYGAGTTARARPCGGTRRRCRERPEPAAGRRGDRVIGADGSLTGFGGGLELKRLLLEHEGALLPL